MNPVFKEYIQFIEETSGENTLLEEGFYWQDRQIIKAYDTEGKLHKILRVHTDESLNVTLSFYKKEEFQIENWNQTVVRNELLLATLELKALILIEKTIKSSPLHDNILLTSMGKDSCVILNLVRKINPNALTLFNNTSLDCADTYKQAKQDASVQILSPKEGFYQWQKKENFIPTRLSRVCCRIFKEEETITHFDNDTKLIFFLGMRKQESTARSGYGEVWKNEKWGSRDWIGCLPIVEWSEEEVWMYIFKEGLGINSKYKKGYSRVGCAIACPNYGKTTWVLDKYWYPKAFQRWQEILRKDFINNNKDLIMNCTLSEYLTCWTGGVFRSSPTEEVIKQFAERNEIEYGVAEKFFGHNCKECDKKIKDKEVLAMNLKLNGRNTSTFHCKKHLMKLHDINIERWNEMVSEFKDQGCALF